MRSDDIRRSYVDFYLRRGHTEIPGGSLLGDSTVLFTSAGMQPLVPYFSGAPHPAGGGWSTRSAACAPSTSTRSATTPT